MTLRVSRKVTLASEESGEGVHRDIRSEFGVQSVCGVSAESCRSLKWAVTLLIAFPCIPYRRTVNALSLLHSI